MSRFVLALSSIVFAFGLAEVLLRNVPLGPPFAPPTSPEAWREVVHRHSGIPGLAYELRPNVQGVAVGAVIRTNSFGIRDEHIMVDRSQSAIRIVACGDSFTFGVGVSSEEAYPNALERLLNGSRNEEICQFDVFNFGVSGYSAKDEALLLEHKAMLVDPHLVIIGYVLNDPDDEPKDPLHWHFSEPAWWEHSHALRVLARARRTLGIWTLGRGDYARWLHANSGKWANVVSAFSDIRASTEKRGIQVLIVIFPMLPPARWEESYPYADIHQRVSNAARENGFHVIDLYEVFSERPPSDLRLGREESHPNRLGHQLAAQTIRDRILRDVSLLFAEDRSELIQRCTGHPVRHKSN